MTAHKDVDTLCFCTGGFPELDRTFREGQAPPPPPRCLVSWQASHSKGSTSAGWGLFPHCG